MGISLALMLPYKTFVQSKLRKTIRGKKRIKGVFKNTKTGKIVKGDNFDCFVVGKEPNAEESYKLALDYYNYTREKGDATRDFVSAEWEEEDLK